VKARWLAMVVAIATTGVALATWSVFQERQAQRIAEGRHIYDTRCSVCHGKNLEGQANWKILLPNGRLPAPPHDEAGHTWHHSDAELFLITKRGMSAVVPGYLSDMPAFEGVLSDTEIRAVLDYVKSTWPERETEYQRSRTLNN
jgi:mono/diheme cytochrome c family protein